MFNTLRTLRNGLFRKAKGNQDGSEFLHVSSKFDLDAKGALPNWWADKFREVADERFKADVVLGCYIKHYQNGTCYHIAVSNLVRVWETTEDDCMSSLPQELKRLINNLRDQCYKKGSFQCSEVKSPPSSIVQGTTMCLQEAQFRRTQRRNRVCHLPATMSFSWKLSMFAVEMTMLQQAKAKKMTSWSLPRTSCRWSSLRWRTSVESMCAALLQFCVLRSRGVSQNLMFTAAFIWWVLKIVVFLNHPISTNF